jgi:hypothetical protein
VKFGGYPVEYYSDELGIQVAGGLRSQGSDLATPLGIARRGNLFDGCSKYLRVTNFLQHISFSYEFQVQVHKGASYTQMMTLYASTPDVYATYNADSGTECIYLFEDKLYYYYQSSQASKTLYASWFVKEGHWGFATVSRYYSTADGTQTASLVVNINQMLKETWPDGPLLDREGHIKTIGA